MINRKVKVDADFKPTFGCLNKRKQSMLEQSKRREKNFYELFIEWEARKRFGLLDTRILLSSLRITLSSVMPKLFKLFEDFIVSLEYNV